MGKKNSTHSNFIDVVPRGVYCEIILRFAIIRGPLREGLQSNPRGGGGTPQLLHLPYLSFGPVCNYLLFA